MPREGTLSPRPAMTNDSFGVSRRAPRAASKKALLALHLVDPEDRERHPYSRVSSIGKPIQYFPTSS
jgi:hypothetical protein